MGFLSKIFGSKVKVPEFKEIDPDVEVQKAFDSIQEQLPQAQRISRNIAEADTDTTLAVLEKIAPGTRDIIQQQVANLQAGLRGELPADVQRAITDRAAARSVQGGFGGSQFARNLELRDLGLTSLQRIDTAMGQSAQALSQYASMTPRSSVGSMFLSPQARLTFAQGERNQQFQRDMAAAQERAKANPVARGLFDAGVAIAGSAVGASVGGFGGSQMGGSAGSVGAGPQPFSTSDFRVTPDSYQYPGSSQSKPGFWGQFGKNLSSLMMQGE
jgi:hypothetical protein